MIAPTNVASGTRKQRSGPRYTGDLLVVFCNHRFPSSCLQIELTEATRRKERRCRQVYAAGPGPELPGTLR